MTRSQFLASLSAVLALVLGVQVIKYVTHCGTVETNLTSRLLDYSTRGPDAFLEGFLDSCDEIGLFLDPEDVSITEDSGGDRVTVEVQYTWDLHLLFLTFEMDRNVTRTGPILDI
jgi:hypothetical protein